MRYTTCKVWTTPGAAQTRPVSPTYGDYPSIRSVVECEDCGQLWMFDVLDSEDWNDDAGGRLLWAPVPLAIGEAQVGDIHPEQVDDLTPRVVVPGHDPASAQWHR
ncbi:MAG: hypothetical protein ACRBCL_01025 [Maritimibacter sp.]